MKPQLWNLGQAIEQIPSGLCAYFAENGQFYLVSGMDSRFDLAEILSEGLKTETTVREILLSPHVLDYIQAKASSIGISNLIDITSLIR